MNLIWYTVLIRAIPETTGVVLIVLALEKEKRSVTSILLAGLMCGLTAFTFRMMPIKFGIHTLLTMVVEVFIVNIVLKIEIKKAFRGILFSFMALGISEMVTMLFMQHVLGLNLETVHSRALNTILLSAPSVLILYLIAFLISRINIKKYSKEVLDNVD